MTHPPSGSSPWVGTSEAFQAFSSDLSRVAAAGVTVLIEGEHGSGKSLAARAIHAASPRSGGPIVEVDLASLAPTLVESELFGHEAGAFTGAEKARVGRFLRGHGGTLVLEGIEVLPGEVQVKLLRVLQERVVEPLGTESPETVDVRVVATSGLPLKAEVEAGRFREDLYYRLAVVTLRVPPLRARLPDLPELARHLVSRVADRTGTPERELSAEALERLREHPWPGNVRELENALERVMVFAPVSGGGAAPDRLVGAQEFAFLSESTEGAAQRIAREALANGLELEELSMALMDEALLEHRGNLSAAARQVGLSRRAFEYRRAKLNGTSETPESPETPHSPHSNRPEESS